MPRLLELCRTSHRAGRRLVAPLAGFPGIRLTGSSIKLAQQNAREHVRVLQAINKRFSPDVVFPLMDLSVEANALGRHTVFPVNDSATVPQDAFDPKDMARMRAVDLAGDSRMRSIAETVQAFRASNESGALVGAYVTGPYTLAALITGAEEAALATCCDPEAILSLCRLATDTIKTYATMLMDAGAEVVCVLEPSGVMLGPADFDRCSGAFVREIVDRCHERSVDCIYHVCGNTMHLAERMAAVGVDGISLDSPETGVNLHRIALALGPRIVIIGNINPTAVMRDGTVNTVRDAVQSLLRQMQAFPNFILSTGCDLPEDVPPENIDEFMRAGRAWRNEGP